MTGPPPGAPTTLFFERSGGFGGLTLHASIALSELSSEELAAVEQCFETPEVAPSGPDRFVYRLRLGANEVVLQEDRVPPGLAAVLRRLGGAWH